MREEGYAVAACAIIGEADPRIEELSGRTLWVKLGELGKVIDFFSREGVTEALLAGKVTKTSLFRGHIKPDLEMIKAVASVRDWKDDSLLGAVVRQLEKKGIRVLESTAFLKKSVPGPGVLTRRKPAPQEREDIEFGWRLAKEMGRLDVGQTVVVKSKAVLAVEAVEGTDEAIRRAGQLGGPGAVVVKVAKPRQDMRFDVPAVGLTTLRALKDIKAGCLALEAGKTIILDRLQFVKEADEMGLAVVLKGDS
jgi:DUF1009 family protein